MDRDHARLNCGPRDLCQPIPVHQADPPSSSFDSAKGPSVITILARGRRLDRPRRALGGRILTKVPPTHESSRGWFGQVAARWLALLVLGLEWPALLGRVRPSPIDNLLKRGRIVAADLPLDARPRRIRTVAAARSG